MSQSIPLRVNGARQVLCRHLPWRGYQLMYKCRKLFYGSSKLIVSSFNQALLSSTEQTYKKESRQPHRSFRSTPISFKKKTKADRDRAEVENDSGASAAEDPRDFSLLNDGVDKVTEKLKNDLSKLRTGGRFNPEILENLRVHLVKDSKRSERLGDLAQVLPKGGRSLMILVGEKEHVKPIVSAIQGSKDLNLQPQPDSHNASQLNVPIPPPTKESRDQALAAASKAGEGAQLGVRNARAAMQKKLRGMELRRVVRPDDLKKAHKEMEQLVEKATVNVKKMVEAARKIMEQS